MQTRPIRSEYAANQALSIDVGIIRAQVHGWHVGANFARPASRSFRPVRRPGMLARIVGILFAR